MDRGIDCSLNRNTGTHGSPTWNLLSCIKDLTLDEGVVEADTHTRGAGDTQVSDPVLNTAEVSFVLQPDKSVADDLADFEAIRDAFRARTKIEFAILDGDITTVGSTGIRGWFKVSKFTRNEAITDFVAYDVTLKPCRPPAGEQVEEMTIAS